MKNLNVIHIMLGILPLEINPRDLMENCRFFLYVSSYESIFVCMCVCKHMYVTTKYDHMICGNCVKKVRVSGT